MDFEEMG
jgi:hypothetical protein